MGSSGINWPLKPHARTRWPGPEGLFSKVSPGNSWHPSLVSFHPKLRVETEALGFQEEQTSHLWADEWKHGLCLAFLSFICSDFMTSTIRFRFQWIINYSSHLVLYSRSRTSLRVSLALVSQIMAGKAHSPGCELSGCKVLPDPSVPGGHEGRRCQGGCQWSAFCLFTAPLECEQWKSHETTKPAREWLPKAAPFTSDLSVGLTDAEAGLNLSSMCVVFMPKKTLLLKIKLHLNVMMLVSCSQQDKFARFR